MNSVAGNKERIAVTTRNRKYGVNDSCSPTKPAAPFSPESWYRKAYEESRSSSRPAPEGAGSVVGSSGTPSPGSGTSSPGSFTGSPGPASPGIGTSSPGSLGGSPGFGTGSPGSGSGGGSSPGSDRGVWCENCNARLVELKRQALKLLIPGPYSPKDPAFSSVIHDKLQVPNTTRKAWNERDNRCDVCATHLNQLKQEAIQMVLTLEQAANAEHCDASPCSPPPLPNIPTLVGSRHMGSLQPRDWAYLSAPYATSNYAGFLPNKLSGKVNNIGIVNGIEKKNGSLGHQTKVSVQMATSPSNGNILNSVAIQAHQYLDGTWSLSRTNGITLYPYQNDHPGTTFSCPQEVKKMGDYIFQPTLPARKVDELEKSCTNSSEEEIIEEKLAHGPFIFSSRSKSSAEISQLITESGRDGLTEAVLNHYNADKPSLYSFPSSQSTCVASDASTGTSVAASFFARAAQKLNLSSKKKKHRPSAPSVSESHLFATKFSMILQTSPPPAPPCLLRAVSKVKDTPGVGKVKVMLRICSTLARDSSESSSFLKVDPRKKQITLYDPLSSGSQNAFQKRSTQVPPKMFVFDAVFPQDASQAEVCAGTVAEVIQSVVNGADGCVFCFGHAKLGKSYTMIGKDDSMQNLGIIPCAISWLFKLIHERKEKTGARFSVRISAVEVWGKEEHLRDLLSEVATGSLQDGQSPGVYLSEDPICGMQLQNQSELRAPTAEKAAFFLDAAIAARRSSQQDCQEEEQKNSHMLFTLHIYQYRMEKSGKGGMSGGRSRLHLIDLGSCVKPLSKNREGGSALCLSLSALGNVILALVNGSKHIPYKDSKLTMLLRESLGNMNCRTTMIAHISAAAGNYAETLSTIQIASRVLRMKKKKTKYTSSSSGGESSCEEGRMRRPTQLRPFHSRNVVDPDFPILHLSSDPDYSSSSEQSCDTVIYVGPNGTALSDKELTDNEGPPDFVPIVPALQKAKNEGKLEEMNETAPERDCLKCNTFAELQERLDCIDGSDETDGFLFEELPVQFNSDPVTKCPLSGQETEHCSASDPSREDDLVVCQEPDKDAKENLNATASQIQGGHSPVHSRMLNEISTPQAHWNVTGSPSSQINSSQQPHCTDLQSSRESLNSSGFLENKPRPMGSPRLGIASLSKASDYKPPASVSQRCKVYTQKGVLPNPAPPPSSLSKDSGMVSSESLMQSESHTPPIGMSPQILKKSLSSGNIDYTEVIEKAEQQQESLSPESKQEILSTTMVTVQQPLELNGEDELVFTLVEELTISGVLENGRPTSIISFNSDCSVQALASGSRPVSIISSISEDLECYSSTAPISEVSITQFLPLPKMGLVDKAEEAESRRSSISSWLSEMSTGSDGEQSCHSFIAQACYGHGEAMAEAPPSELAKAVCINDKQNRCTEDMFVSPEGVDRNTNKLSPIRSCKISALEKTTVTISNTTSVSSCEGFIPMKTNITVFPHISVNSFKAQEGHEAISSVSSSARTPYLYEGKESNARKDLKFDDPWLKREDCAKNEHGLKAEKVPEQNKKQNSADRFSSSSGEISSSPGTENPRRVIDECETGLPGSATHSPLHSTESLKNGSLSRGFQKNNKLEELDVVSCHYVEESGGMSSSVSSQTSKASLERKIASPKHGVLTRPKGTPPLPPVRKSSLEQKNRASPQHNACSSSTSSSSNQPPSFLASFPDESSGKQKSFSMESGSNSSSKLFSAKLEQLASRTNSLGRSNGSHYECLSLERAESLSSVSSKMNIGKDTTMPRASRSLNRNAISSPTNSGFSQSAGASPKASQSKISAVSKLLLASPKARSLAASTTKTLSFSTKSLPQSVGQSSSLPPNGKNMSWSTQSLSRNRGSGLSSKLPLRAVNGRISELLQGNAGTRGMQLCRNSDTDERSSIHGDKKPSVHLLPSPYSKITPPRKPHRCSSGHGSDNSSVLSGELPPAMGKTALFYHSGGSSGYESMIRDSEATGSTSSAQDSMSENSSSISGRCRSLKTPKKRSNTGSQRRRLIPALSLDTTSPIRKPTNPAIRWVDGPLRSAQRGMGEPFEIKVYEIDDVERLQRRRMGDNNEVICYNAKLKILEHRQQRIAEVKAKYEWLMRELEVTKQYLMLDPNKWLSEFDLEHVFDSDSLEYLEALECVTERLENRVNYCKAHLMMITCFDISSRRR